MRTKYYDDITNILTLIISIVVSATVIIILSVFNINNLQWEINPLTMVLYIYLIDLISHQLVHLKYHRQIPKMNYRAYYQYLLWIKHFWTPIQDLHERPQTLILEINHHMIKTNQYRKTVEPIIERFTIIHKQQPDIFRQIELQDHKTKQIIKTILITKSKS